MRALRLGSYSMAATLAGTPSLFRLKSTMRYCCLWPPPRWRDVLRPYELRPPVRGLGASRLFSGRSLVISLKSETVWNRRPALVGLRLRRGMKSFLAFEQRDALSLGEGDDGPLGVGPLAERGRAPVALALALAIQGVDLDDLDAEERLDGLADLDLVGIGMHDERVDAGVEQRVRLLRHHRLEDDVPCVLHSASSASSSTAVSSATSTEAVGSVAVSVSAAAAGSSTGAALGGAAGVDSAVVALAP